MLSENSRLCLPPLVLAASISLLAPPCARVAAPQAQVAPSPTATARVAPSRATLVARIDSLAAAAVVEGPLAGVSVAVVRGRDTLLMKGYGFADLENRVPATERTVHRIGSVTKQFTAAALMQLVDAGRIGLDDQITKYLPEYPTQGKRVTVRQLLNHTSGIRSFTRFSDEWLTTERNDVSQSELLALFQSDPFDFEPGSRWRYNNSGYYLLGVILERVTGKPYAEQLQERIFGPLGMSGTRYCDTRTLIPGRADGYDVVGRSLVNARHISMTSPYAAGALCSTVGDLVAWERALREGASGERGVVPRDDAASRRRRQRARSLRIRAHVGHHCRSSHGRSRRQH